MKNICAIILAFAAVSANAITATKEYVDRRDGENAVATTNLVESATNAIPRVTDSTVAGWGYIKSWTETDPTVPSWAKATSKPSYTWTEISNKPSWIGASKPSYTWSEIGSKPTTFAPSAHSHVSDSWFTKALSGKLSTTGGTLTGTLTVAASGGLGVSFQDGYLGLLVDSIIWQKDESPSYFYHFPEESGTLALASDIPTALKCPNALTIQLNGTTAATYDGSAARTVNITTGGAPGATVASAALEYHADGQAISVSVAASGTLTAVINSWTDGQSQMAFVTLAAGASIAPAIKLIGYSEWPIGEEFMAVCTKRGSKIYVNPVCITEE